MKLGVTVKVHHKVSYALQKVFRVKFEREANISRFFLFRLLLSKKNFNRERNLGNSINERKRSIISFIHNF